MDNKKLTCIGCPMGCQLNVKIENGIVTSVKGNKCARGKEYAEKECINPVRVVTTTVKIKNAPVNVVSVKTSEEIPKSKIKDIIEALKGISVTAPVEVGDIVVENICGTDANITITRSIKST